MVTLNPQILSALELGRPLKIILSTIGASRSSTSGKYAKNCKKKVIRGKTQKTWSVTQGLGGSVLTGFLFIGFQKTEQNTLDYIRKFPGKNIWLFWDKKFYLSEIVFRPKLLGSCFKMIAIRKRV